MTIRVLTVKRGRIERLNIEELEVGRLYVREVVVDQEQRDIVTALIKGITPGAIMEG